MRLAHIVHLYVSLKTYKNVDSFPNSINRLHVPSNIDSCVLYDT